jgi:hypothetical protein
MVALITDRRGVSAIGAILAILIFALLISVIVSVITIGASVGLQEELGIKAFYIAEGGMQYAIENGTPPCDFNVPTATPLGGGTFIVNSSCMGSGSGCAAAETVQDNPLGAADTFINMSSIAGYVIPGTVKVDDEYIRCESSSGNQFQDCTRGWGGSTAAAHAQDTEATQCVVTATGTYSAGTFFGDVVRTTQASVGE